MVGVLLGVPTGKSLLCNGHYCDREKSRILEYINILTVHLGKFIYIYFISACFVIFLRDGQSDAATEETEERVRKTKLIRNSGSRSRKHSTCRATREKHLGGQEADDRRATLRPRTSLESPWERQGRAGHTV